MKFFVIQRSPQYGGGYLRAVGTPKNWTRELRQAYRFLTLDAAKAAAFDGELILPVEETFE